MHIEVCELGNFTNKIFKTRLMKVEIKLTMNRKGNLIVI